MPEVDDRTLELKLEQGRASIRWLNAESEVPLTVGMIDAMVTGLSRLRAHLAPEVPRTIDLHGPFETTPDPAWRTDSEAMAGNPLIHLRHPGLGWLTFLLPRQEARNLAKSLARLADAPEPTGRQRPS